MLSEQAFAGMQRLLLQRTGIGLGPGKQALVQGRLGKRLQHHRLGDFDDYLRLLQHDSEEQRIAIELLTTNETHFFREPAHFQLLACRILPALGQRIRIWSAAASTGQEAWSAAMVLARHAAGRDWQVVGTDIATHVLEKAERGIYDLALAAEIPQDYRQAYCLRGVGEHKGCFAIGPELRPRVAFSCVNLNDPLPEIGSFDVIFLRNVLIYFPPDSKRRVVAQARRLLRPGGWLLVGHAESLGEFAGDLECLAPSIYRGP